MDKAFFSVQKALKASLRRIMSNQNDIDDVVQETYLRAVASNTSNSIKDPEAYLFRTSRNIAINQQARMYRRLESSLPEDELDLLTSLLENRSKNSQLETEYDSKQQFADFCLAVSELPMVCRKVFVLRKVYGFSQKEIASKLGITVSTVETHISKGMRRTRQSIDNSGKASLNKRAMQDIALRKGDVNG